MRLVLLIAAAFLAAAAAEPPVSEPPGLWQGAMHGQTPNSLHGATVIGTEVLADLRIRAQPLLLDVAEAERRPPATAKDVPWMPIHRSIPGATWLPGAGSGSDDPAFAAAFRTALARLTGNDIDRPIVTFCHPRCWGSWNAAKRLVGLGYPKVYWYPEGVEGWQAGHDTEILREDPDWRAPSPRLGSAAP